MGKYKLENLLDLWEAEKVTPEQAIGQIIQHLLELRGQLYEAENRLRELERQKEDE
jgi:flagellar biosynthesis chaperone FliJ